jgi:hypothetical protein
MEGDFDQVAQRLDRYPNFAVDLAGRIPYLMLQPRTTMIAFITKYQDRLIYGTNDALYPQADVQKMVAGSEASYARDWRFLATNNTVDYRGRKIQGLALPEPILQKLYHDTRCIGFPIFSARPIELFSRLEEVDRLPHKQVERAKYEAHLAKRRYL